MKGLATCPICGKELETTNADELEQGKSYHKCLRFYELVNVKWTILPEEYPDFSEIDKRMP